MVSSEWLRPDCTIDNHASALASQQEKRAELRECRRRKHVERERKRQEQKSHHGQHLPPTPQLPVPGSPTYDFERFSIYGDRAAQLVNPSIAQEKSIADELFGDPNVCPICTEPLCHAAVPLCGHIFCEGCILQTALQADQQMCPLCRAPWCLETLSRHREKDKAVAAAFPVVARQRGRRAAAVRADLRAAVRDLEARRVGEGVRQSAGQSDGTEEQGIDVRIMRWQTKVSRFLSRLCSFSAAVLCVWYLASHTHAHWALCQLYEMSGVFRCSDGMLPMMLSMLPRCPFSLPLVLVHTIVCITGAHMSRERV